MVNLVQICDPFLLSSDRPSPDCKAARIQESSHLLSATDRRQNLKNRATTYRNLSDLMLALIQQREKKDRTDDLNVQVQDEIGMVREDSKVRILAVEMILWHKRWHMTSA
uniref:Uncharacterized protein n=1 Tax=Oryza meridionalis TaxID=40149 RepID=A0A0E0ETU5_9ORYZ